MNDLMTVIRFTVANKMRSKSFKVTLVIFVLILTVMAHIPFFIQLFSSDETAKYGIFQREDNVTERLVQFVNGADHVSFELVVYPDPGTAEEQDRVIRQAIEKDEVKGFLQLSDAAEEGAFPAVTYKAENTMDFGGLSELQNVLTNIKTELVLEDLNLSEQHRQQLFAPIQFETVQISVGGGMEKSESQMFVAYGMVYLLMIMLFMAIMITGQLIATEITTEKSSRIMEILVTSVAPLKQMFGKIIGMLIVGLSQILVLAAAAVANLLLPHNREAIDALNINFMDIDPLLLIYFIVFYLTGYFLYATLYAAVGSIVSRTEDLGQAVMPITFLALAAFYIGIFGLSQPTSPFIVAMSYVPFFSPLIMFLRIGMTQPHWWEIALSIAILLASIFAFGWLSAKIYRTGVLMYGKRPSFKELRKAMKAFKV
jgi:ABC-2 type transport system permease protein